MKQSEVSIEHCTLEPNIGVINNTGVVVLLSECRVINSIVRGTSYGTVDATYSDILGVTGEGNIDLDPGFRSPFTQNPDFRLRADSPCIDAATGSTLTLDLDGNPRPVDVLGRGNDSGFDMGAYEFQLKRSDLNENGRVDGEDLLMFQEEWMREGE